MSFDAEHPYLERYGRKLDSAAIRSERARQTALRKAPAYAPYAGALAAVRPFRTQACELASEVVVIGERGEMDESSHERFVKALRTFMPWKKGPFRLFGVEIDAEWQSQLKWQRLAGHFTDLAGRKVADIGCHNGYFMFRMAAAEPELVVGFEPVAKHWYNFALLQQFARLDCLAFEPLGVEHIDFYPQFFDSVFCLGILYHHTDPLGLLRKIRASMVPGGELIIDCQGIPGEEPLALVPASRYAQARGIWFLPTLPCLLHWLARSGFRDFECFYAAPLTSEEQRSTAWAPVASLAEFLNPEDSSRTVEGYPAPWRFYVKALR